MPSKSQQSPRAGTTQAAKAVSVMLVLASLNLPSTQKPRQEGQDQPDPRGEPVQRGGAGVWLSDSILKTHQRAECLQLGVGVSQVT